VEINVTPQERDIVSRTARALSEEYHDVESEQLLQTVPLVTHDLPQRILRAFHEFRLCEPDESYLLVSGLELDDHAIGPTPSHWCHEKSAATLPFEMSFLLLGSLLGEPFGWSTQQAGHVMHEIVPIRGDEYRQINSASEATICWHTEDAFHDCRPDYVGLACLRNPTNTATTVAPLGSPVLDEVHEKALFERRFVINIDESHKASAFLDGGQRAAVEPNDEVGAPSPRRVAVLSGGRDAPYVRADPYFMPRLEDDPVAQQALEALCAYVDGRLADVVLQPGDICFIDNFRAVHGRNPFHANFDGKDRWLKRLLITRDLRKSRALRSSASAHVIE